VPLRDAQNHGVADHAHAVLLALRPDARAHAPWKDLEPIRDDGRLLLGSTTRTVSSAAYPTTPHDTRQSPVLWQKSTIQGSHTRLRPPFGRSGPVPGPCAVEVTPGSTQGITFPKKSCENASFIGRISSSWKPQIRVCCWRSGRATSGSTKVLRANFSSEAWVWRAVELAKTHPLLGPPNAGLSIAQQFVQ